MPLEIPAELAAARAEVARLAEERRTLVASGGRLPFAELGRVDLGIATVIDALRDRVDPCDAAPEVPLVLLPVRVETKLKPGTSTLRVRITPDEVHVDALLRAVTPEETAAGRAYWTRRWADEADPAAWGDLVTAAGARRAGWVAQATTPTNLAERGGAGGAPVFPDTPEEVTRGTVARCLPDRFVVRAFPRGSAPVTARGETVARDIPISPVALSNLDDVANAAEGLTLPTGSEWIADFDAAKAAGLGVELTLPTGTQVVDRLVVVGVRGSASEDENAAELADLLLSHRFSDGFGLLAPGTPTNNADAERSPYRASDAPGEPPIDAPQPGADASALAAVLGLDPVAIEHLLDPAAPRSGTDAAERSANTALWFATWEPVLQRLDDAEVPGVTPATIESARRLHRDHVRGAGPAPAIRVGAQPYGVLPVADLDAWSPRDGDPTASLVAVIRRTLRRWIDRAATLPRVRPGDSVTDEALLDLLGTSPEAVGVRARPAVDGPDLALFAAATGAGASVDAEMLLRRAVLAQYSAHAARLVLPASLHDQTRTINLPFVSERDAPVVTEILADRTPQVDSVLQALLVLAWDDVKRVRLRVAPDEFVSPLLERLELPPDVVQLVRASLDRPEGQVEGDGRDAGAVSARFFAAAQSVRAVVHVDGQPAEQLSIAAIEPVAEARTSLAQVALDLGDDAHANWIGSHAIAGLLDWLGVRAEVRAAMDALAAAPIGERQTAVAHALDVASHRADAWATALASSRRATLAVANPTGLTLGAFGYVEDLRLTAERGEPEGWIHAPSTAHAVAAGVLASAHRSNIGAKDGAHPFAIDLTSRRGADLRRVLEGVHGGQPIGALLGYQIERGLAGTQAARFQLTLRELAPMATDELGNELAAVDTDAERAQARAAVADVVDGVSLLRQFPVASLSGPQPPLRAKLAARPKSVFVETWPAVGDDEWALVVAALMATSETLDALSDALLAESVVQYASGNAARASAALDAMGSGASLDPQLDVLGVRAPSRQLSQAAIVVVPRGATGWSATRPRAIADPRLEAWAARRLGDPADVVVAEAGGTQHTLEASGLAALDLVYADDPAAVERMIRAAMPALGDAPIAAERGDGWPARQQPLWHVVALAQSLRTVIARSTRLGPSALVRVSAPAQRAVDTDELLERVDRLLGAFQDALDSGAGVIGALDPATLAVEPAAAPAIAAAVRPLEAFGVPTAPPSDPDLVGNVAWAWGAWQAAASRLGQARAALDGVRAPRPAGAEPPGPEELCDAAQSTAEAVLGDGFRLLPLLSPPAAAAGEPDAFAQAVADPAFAAPSRARLHAFVRDHATVLDGMAALAEAQLVGGALGRRVDITAVQLTERTGTGPAPGTDRWLAGALADDVPWPDSTATHLVVELPPDADDVAGPLAGLAIEAWVEALPFQPDVKAFDPRAPETALRAARSATGLAVSARQASARAPQVLLSAISPDGRRWTTDSVVQTVLDAVDLAKARLVTLEHVPGDAAVLPAIYVASPWLQARKGLGFEELAAVAWDPKLAPFLSEVD